MPKPNIRLLYIIFAILTLGCINAKAAPTATSILDKTAATFTRPASVTVKFKMAGADNGQGTLTMSHDKFALKTAGISIWYNGKTQWALQHKTHEVNLTEPTPDELVESNPFALISSYKANYNVSLLNSTKDYYHIQLSAKRRHAQIKRAVLTVSRTNHALKSIDATLSDNSTLTVHVTSFTPGKALPANTFEFNKSSHRGVKLIDLR